MLGDDGQAQSVRQITLNSRARVAQTDSPDCGPRGEEFLVGRWANANYLCGVIRPQTSPTQASPANNPCCPREERGMDCKRLLRKPLSAAGIAVEMGPDRERQIPKPGGQSAAPPPDLAAATSRPPHRDSAVYCLTPAVSLSRHCREQDSASCPVTCDRPKLAIPLWFSRWHGGCSTKTDHAATAKGPHRETSDSQHQEDRPVTALISLAPRGRCVAL